MKLKLPRVSQQALQFSVAGLLALTGVALAVFGVWFFRTMPAPSTRSLWQIILSDRATLGFVRLAILMLALYTISSVGNWNSRRSRRSATRPCA
jgi:H+/Cl- antiporter ClcA